MQFLFIIFFTEFRTTFSIYKRPRIRQEKCGLNRCQNKNISTRQNVLCQVQVTNNIDRHLPDLNRFPNYQNDDKYLQKLMRIFNRMLFARIIIQFSSPTGNQFFVVNRR